MNKAVFSRMVRTKNHFRKPARSKSPSKSKKQLRDWMAWMEYTAAFEAYVREPGPEAIERMCVTGWGGVSEPVIPNDYLIRRLFVLEPEDLADFSLDDLSLAWQHRRETCGSLVAAAEMMALQRVSNGEDESYIGAGHYLSHPDVLAIFYEESSPCVPTHNCADIAPATDSISKSKVLHYLADVRGFSAGQLTQAWYGRPDSFGSLEAAAETLASLRMIRFDNAEKMTFEQFIDHPLIKELEDELPRELDIRPAQVSVKRELELLAEDRRIIRNQFAVVRTGQRDFRASLLSRYGGVCCVTGCAIERLVEAAHIVPYRGSQTDGEDNGLLLRVDVHRLFDEYLVSINPERYTFIVSATIADPAYRSLDGIRMFQLTKKPRRIFLETHYQRYLRKEDQRGSR